MTIYTVTKVRYLEGYGRTQELLGAALTNQKAHQLAYPHTRTPEQGVILGIIEDVAESELMDEGSVEHILIQDWEAE